MTFPQISAARYIPGVCNIGPAEIQGRKRIGFLFGWITLASLGALFLWHADRIFSLFIFFPATISTLGFLQAYMHFCVAFGMEGLFNVSESDLKTETVEQSEWRAKDKRKAIIMISGGILVGTLLTLISLVFLS